MKRQLDFDSVDYSRINTQYGASQPPLKTTRDNDSNAVGRSFYYERSGSSGAQGYGGSPQATYAQQQQQQHRPATQRGRNDEYPYPHPLSQSGPPHDKPRSRVTGFQAPQQQQQQHHSQQHQHQHQRQHQRQQQQQQQRGMAQTRVTDYLAPRDSSSSSAASAYGGTGSGGGGSMFNPPQSQSGGYTDSPSHRHKQQHGGGGGGGGKYYKGATYGGPPTNTYHTPDASYTGNPGQTYGGGYGGGGAGGSSYGNGAGPSSGSGYASQSYAYQTPTRPPPTARAGSSSDPSARLDRSRVYGGTGGPGRQLPKSAWSPPATTTSSAGPSSPAKPTAKVTPNNRLVSTSIKQLLSLPPTGGGKSGAEFAIGGVPLTVVETLGVVTRIVDKPHTDVLCGLWSLKIKSSGKTISAEYWQAAHTVVPQFEPGKFMRFICNPVADPQTNIIKLKIIRALPVDTNGKKSELAYIASQFVTG